MRTARIRANRRHEASVEIDPFGIGVQNSATSRRSQLIGYRRDSSPVHSAFSQPVGLFALHFRASRPTPSGAKSIPFIGFFSKIVLGPLAQSLPWQLAEL